MTNIIEIRQLNNKEPGLAPKPFATLPIDENPSGADRNNDRLLVAGAVFNTSASKGNTTNVAGNFITYGVEAEHLSVKMALDRLPYAEGVSWDPRLVCLLGTRRTIMALVQEWSCSDDPQNVFWLEGVAGSGKTAIAHAVAQVLHRLGILASTFFFNRNVISRNNPQMLITTIARDVANRHPALAADISRVLEEELGLASAPITRQYEALILGPLQRHRVDGPIVIVIDALDESDADDANLPLLSILRTEAGRLPSQFRIFVTSRPTRIIRQSLLGMRHVRECNIDINSPESRRDIAVYVDAQLVDNKALSELAQDRALIHSLKIKAEGLFIWISTILSYLRNAYNPKAKLRALLSNSTAIGIPDADEKMDALYTVILDTCGFWDDEEFIKDYQLVMGVIMAAERPLSSTTLRALCDDLQDLPPARLLERFGSVIVGFDDEHEPIRILHLSFREFVTNRADKNIKTRKFFISQEEHSHRLAAFCLKTIARELKSAPITGLGYLETDSDESPGIPKLHGISEQLLYACEALPRHIAHVKKSGNMTPLIVHFLSRNRTRWLEIVASHSVFSGSLSIRLWLEAHASELLEMYEDKIQAEILSSLAKRLSYVGRLEEGLIAMQEAVDLCRGLASAAGELEAPRAALAYYLNGVSVRLSHLGRRDEALVACQEALELYRGLAITHPDSFRGGLAASLNNTSNYLLDNDRPEECLSMCEEAVSLFSALAKEQPEDHNVNVAASLASLSNRLSAAGRQEESLKAIEEATSLYRTLVAMQPAKYNPALSMALGSLSSRLSGLKSHEDALKAIQESLQICRALAVERPRVYNAQLASALHSLSTRLMLVSRNEEALVAVNEAIGLRRALMEGRPTAFNELLAQSLHSSFKILSGLDRQREALSAIEEIVELYRPLAKVRPKEFDAYSEMARHQLDALSPPHSNEYFKTSRDTTRSKGLSSSRLPVWPSARPHFLVDSIYGHRSRNV
ncbi:hypothetical protein HWV62_14044 [Athelia sp. TMB]|nr:hypothetical protein HWV62_14044 [Athelia sp. TMB]